LSPRGIAIKRCNGREIALAKDMKTSTIATVVTLFAVPAFAQSSKAHNGMGATIFQEQCIVCHGPDGRAQNERGTKVGAADLTSESVQQQSDATLSKIVHEGKRKMPAFEGKLTDEEIDAVVGYIRQLAKKR
jgi:mono/diheme cytochrome c family protein